MRVRRVEGPVRRLPQGLSSKAPEIPSNDTSVRAKASAWRCNQRDGRQCILNNNQSTFRSSGFVEGHGLGQYLFIVTARFPATRYGSVFVESVVHKGRRHADSISIESRMLSDPHSGRGAIAETAYLLLI